MAHSGPGALQRTRWGLAWLFFFVQFCIPLALCR